MNDQDPLDAITLGESASSFPIAPKPSDQLDKISLLSTNQGTPPAMPQMAITQPAGITGGIQKANVVTMQPPVPDAELGYLARNQQLGVPLDVHSEVGPWHGLMGSLRREQGDRVKYLIDNFGPENVRVDDKGEPIVRITDPTTGKQKDVLFNAWGMSVNDLMTVAGALPQAVGAYLGMRAGKSIPGGIGASTGAKGFLRNALAGAIGAESVGAAEDVATRLYDQQAIRPGEIAATRAANVPVDMALDVALAGAGKVGQWAFDTGRMTRNLTKGQIPVPINLSKLRGPIQNDALAAQKLIQDKTGISLPLGPHETTGVPFVAQAWEYLRNYPSSAKVIQKFEDVRDTAMRAFQEYMYTPTTLKTDAELGQNVVDVLSALKKRRGESLLKAGMASEKSVTEAIQNVGAEISTEKPRQDFAKIGQNVREKIIALRDAAKQEQNLMRQNIAAMPGGTGKVFDSQATGLTARAERILRELPSPETVISEPSGLVDQFGKPVMRTKTAEVLEKPFVPSGVVERLRSLAKEKKFSLHDLIQMRSDVYEDIAAGQAVPGTGTHYLNEIGKMLTETIDKGIDQIPNPELKKALLAANKQYKEKVIPFEYSGISGLFSRVEEPGFIENIDVTRRLIGDSEKYNRAVSFLGRGSPEHEQLKRGVFEQVIRDSADNLEGSSINPAALIQRLKDMAGNPKTRAIFRDVFGDKGASITSLADTLRVVKGATAGNITKEEAEKLLSDPRANIFAFANLVRNAQANAKLYKNKIVKSLARDEFDATAIRPDEFIDKFLSTGSLDDIRQVWGALSHHPDLQEQIARKQLERIFTRGERSLEPGDVAARARGEMTHVVSAQGLVKAMGPTEDVKKLEAVIGKERLDLLQAFTSVKAAEDWARAEGGGTGLLTKGSAVGGLLRMKFNPIGMSKELIGLVKNKVIATLLTSRSLSKITASTFHPTEMPALFRAIVTSEPFVKAVIDDAPDDKSRYEILGAAKRMAGLVGEQ